MFLFCEKRKHVLSFSNLWHIIFSLILINFVGLCLCDDVEVDDISSTATTSDVVDNKVNWHLAGNDSSDDVTGICVHKCFQEEKFYLDDLKGTCSNDHKTGSCFMAKCSKGCLLWRDTLSDFVSCQEACTASQLHSYDMTCVSGCEMALSQYRNMKRIELEALMTSVTPITLDETPNSVDLTIRLPLVLPANQTVPRPVSIQYKYGNLSSNQWNYLSDYNCFENFTCDISNSLRHNTKYRFRFVLPLDTERRDVIYSQPSDIIEVLEDSMPPESSPIIIAAYALDYERIAVFWQSGDSTNGNSLGYRLRLSQENGNYTIDKELEPFRNSTILVNLRSNEKYKIALRMLNAAGAGPPAEISVSTLPIPRESILDTHMDLIIVGEYSIQMQKQTPLPESTLIYQSDQVITGFAVHLREQWIFAIDSTGMIYRTNFDNLGKFRQGVISPQDLEFKAAELTLDWLNSKIYIVGENRSDNWIIARSEFSGLQVQIVADDLEEKPHHIQIDPINGFIFWINRSKGLFRLDLADNSMILLTKGSQFGAFHIDSARYAVLVTLKNDKNLLEFNFDGSESKTIEMDNEMYLHGVIQSLVKIGQSIFYMTNGTHMLRWNKNSNIIDIWAIKEFEWCWGMIPNDADLMQPIPTPIESPINLEILITTNIAKVRWQPSPRNLLQSPAAWQLREYDLEISEESVDNNLAIRNIKTEYFTVENLNPNTQYSFRIRTTGSGGPWSKSVQVKTWPIAEKRFLLWTSANNGIFRTNLIGEDVKQIAGDLKNVTSVTRINETLLFVTNETIGNLNMENGQIQMLNISAKSIAYDWKGAKIYWIDPETHLVIRGDIDGNRREILEIFGVQEFCLDSSNGYIYYSTGLRIVGQPIIDLWLHENEVEYFHAAQLFGGDEILSLTIDIEVEKLYWIVGRKNTSGIKLYSSGIAAKNNEVKKRNSESQGSPESLTSIEQRLFLIESKNSNTARIIDSASLKTQAHIILQNITDLSHVYLIDGFTAQPDLSVYPAAIDNATIRIEGGFWNDFNITWNPVVTSRNYSIFYKIIIQSDEGIKVLQSSIESVRITDFRQPYIPLNVSIYAQTFWASGPRRSCQLQTPAAAPSQPRRLRIFVTRSVDAIEFNWNISAILRWEPPSDTSTPIVAYKIFYRLGEELFSEIYLNLTENDQRQQQQQAIVHGLQEDVTYSFQVQAFTDGQSGGGGEKTAIHSIHINPEMQSIPKLLIATSDYVGELDMDLNQTIVLVYTKSKITNLSYMQGEKRILWINENLELMSYVHGTKPIPIATMRAEVLSLTIDWISRIVYWAEVDFETEMGSVIYSIDLCQFEGEPLVGTRIITIPERKLVKDLIVLPFSQMLLWLEVKQVGPAKNTNGQLVGRNLTDLSLINLRNGSFIRMFEDSFESDRQTVNLIDVREKICSYDFRRSACAPVKVNYEKDEIFDITRDSGYIYALRQQTIRAYSRKKQILEYLVHVDDVNTLQAFNHQPYPEEKCLLPDYHADSLKQIIPKVLVIGENNLTLLLPQIPTPLDCGIKRLPGVKYVLRVNDLHSESQHEIISYRNQVNVTQLKAFTKYTLKLVVTSFHAMRLNLSEIEGDELLITTAPSAPSVPRNVSARSISPSQVLVDWEESSEINSDVIWYQVHWRELNSTEGEFMRINLTSTLIDNLEPDSEYSIWIKAFTTDTKFNSSEAIIVRTFPEPIELELLSITPYNLTLSWELPNNVITALLEYSILEGNNESRLSIDVTANSSYIVIPNLEPKTKYHLMLRLTYDIDSEGRTYVWPEKLPYRFTFETLGDCPSAPGKPLLELISGEVFKVTWQAARSNGEPIQEYSVEALQRSLSRRIRRGTPIEKIYMNKTIAILSQLPSVEELDPIEDKWIVYWNGTELSCIVKDMHTRRLWRFRVRARNHPYGWGPYSVSSDPVSEPFVTPEKWNSLVFAIVAPAAIVSTFVLLLIVVRWIQNRRVKAKKLLKKSRHSIWGFDDLVSFQQQQQQQQQQVMESRSRNFSQTSHTLYTGGPLTDGDIALLPQIKWNQVTIKRFLGSGFFGEVYEGLLRYSEEAVQDSVAIKTLRRGASDFEKAELLQEAQLMSNFKHNHIVKLIGVCFDSETISIIMEHMEGGDLLSYLRQSRPMTVSTPTRTAAAATLHLTDLISMCADVATGCRYLEDMHFVHRDLACRNCLVSSIDPAKRIVKIGDFGLARDIYKNDYYRKEGEGLLPVRWMPPESLVDGVFTSQSDIWAFGVLCWEILTLGQQPYPARTNFEVLNYVKNGGYPDKPDNCPDKLYALLLKCWSYLPDDRPNFHFCLKELLELKMQAMEDSYGLLSSDDGLVNCSYDETLDDDSDIKVPLACNENVDEESIDDDRRIAGRSKSTSPSPHKIDSKQPNIDGEVSLRTFSSHLLSIVPKESQKSNTISRRSSFDANNSTELTSLPPIDSNKDVEMSQTTSSSYANEGCSRL